MACDVEYSWISGGVRVNGVDVEIHDLDKRLGGLDGTLTRRKIVEYYLSVAPVLLAYLHRRRLSGVRYPQGIDRPGFHLKTAPKRRPSWVNVVPAPYGEATGSYVCVDSPATLAWLAGTDVLELQIPHTTFDRPDSADGVILDLDPGPGRDLGDAAHLASKLIETYLYDREVLLKTSGRAGLHLYVPAESSLPLESAIAEARTIATDAGERWDSLATSVTGVKNRVGKVLIDWQQNVRHRTTAAPYSLRGGSVLGVSTPLRRDELELLERSPFHPTPTDVLTRIATLGDVYHH